MSTPADSTSGPGYLPPPAPHPAPPEQNGQPAPPAAAPVAPGFPASLAPPQSGPSQYVPSEYVAAAPAPQVPLSSPGAPVFPDGTQGASYRPIQTKERKTYWNNFIFVLVGPVIAFVVVAIFILVQIANFSSR